MRSGMHQSNHNHSVVSSITWEGDSEQTVVIEDEESGLKWGGGACNWMRKITGEVAGMKTRPSSNKYRSAYFSASSSETELLVEHQMHSVASFPSSLVVRNDEEEISISSTRVPLPVPKPIERPSSISIPSVPVVPLHAPPEPIQYPSTLTASFPSTYPLSETTLPPIGWPLVPSTSLAPSSQFFDVMPEHIAPLLVIPVGVASQLAKTFGHHHQEKIRKRIEIGKVAAEAEEEETFWLSGDYKPISDVCGCDPRAWRSPSKFCLLLRPTEVLNGSNVPDVDKGADVVLPVTRSRSGTGSSTLEEGRKATVSMNRDLNKFQERIGIFVDSGPHIGIMPRNIADEYNTERSGIISLHAQLSMRNISLRFRKCISPLSASLGATFAGTSLWEVSEGEGRITLAENSEHKLLLWPNGKEVQNKDGDVVGIWFRGSTDVRHPRLWSICKHLLSETHSEAPFIVILVPEFPCPSSTADPLACLECYEVQAHSAGRDDMVSLDFSTIIDSTIVDKDDVEELTVIGRFRPIYFEHPGLQESILPGHRKMGVYKILCDALPYAVSPVNPKCCDDLLQEGPGLAAKLSSSLMAPVSGEPVLNLSIEELNTLDATTRKIFLEQQKQLLALQEQLEELRADVRTSHDMAISAMRASIPTLYASASAGIAEPVEHSITHSNPALLMNIAASAEPMAAAINHSSPALAPFKDKGGLDFGNATTEEFIAPILAPPNHSLVSTTSCLETEINTSFLLNAEMVAPAWGAHHVHGEETDVRLDVDHRDHQHRQTREEGESSIVVQFEKWCAPQRRCVRNDIPTICGPKQQGTPKEDDSSCVGEVETAIYNDDTITPAVTSSSLKIEGLINEPLLLRTERLLQKIPTIRYSMHGHRNSVKNAIDIKTDEETISLELGCDEGDNTLMEIEVKYLCCPTAASE